jgi:uncharacterized RmlC-like cupin family protein
MKNTQNFVNGIQEHHVPLEHAENTVNRSSCHDVVVIRPQNRYCDAEHGFERGWGISAKLTGSAALSMATGKLKAGVRSTAHAHDFETGIKIEAGGCRVYYGNRPNKLDSYVDVKKDDFIYIPAGIYHMPVTTSQEPMEYVVCRNTPIED